MHQNFWYPPPSPSLLTSYVNGPYHLRVKECGLLAGKPLPPPDISLSYVVQRGIRDKATLAQVELLHVDQRNSFEGERRRWAYD